MISEVLLSLSLLVASPATVVEQPEGPHLEYLGQYTITAYSYEEGGGENFGTAGGYDPEPYYTVAATEDIPIGTELYIEDFGAVQVQDRGSFPAGIIDMHIGHDEIDSFPMHETEVYVIRR